MSSKNIVFNEDGVRIPLNNISKIKTCLADDSSCYWVPEENTELTTINIDKDGVYRASGQGYYGYSEVNVNGNGTQIIGDVADKQVAINQNGSYSYIASDESHQGYSQIKLLVDINNESNTARDSSSGNEINSYTNPITGVTTKTALPSYIRVETLPQRTEYTYGSNIDYTGIEVYAYTNAGELWKNDEYPNGRIPFDELILPTQEAGSGIDGSPASPNKINYNYNYMDKLNFIPITTDTYEDDNIIMEVTGSDINNGKCFIAVFLKNNGSNGGFITQVKKDGDTPDCTVTILDKTSLDPNDETSTYRRYTLSMNYSYATNLPGDQSQARIIYGRYILNPTSSVQQGQWNNYNIDSDNIYEEAAWITYAYNSDYINTIDTLSDEKVKSTSYNSTNDFIYKFGFKSYKEKALYYEAEVSFKKASYYSDEYSNVNNNGDTDKMIVFAASQTLTRTHFGAYTPFYIVIFTEDANRYRNNQWLPVIYERRYIGNTTVVSEAFLPHHFDASSGTPTTLEVVFGSGNHIALKNGKTIYYRYGIVFHGYSQNDPSTNLSEYPLHITHIDGTLNYVDCSGFKETDGSSASHSYNPSSSIITREWMALMAALLYDTEDIQTTIVPRQSGDQSDDSGEGGSEGGSEGSSDPSTIPTTTQMIRVGWKRPKDDKQLNTTFPITVTARIDEGWEEP